MSKGKVNDLRAKYRWMDEFDGKTLSFPSVADSFIEIAFPSASGQDSVSDSAQMDIVSVTSVLLDEPLESSSRPKQDDIAFRQD